MKFRFLNESADISRSQLKKALINSGVNLPQDESLTEAVSSDSDEFQAYITNLGKYNDGELVGEWVTFPIDSSEFDSILDRIGCNEHGYEEWFVTDYECVIDAYDILGEYPSFEQLNEFAEMIEDDAFKALLDYFGDYNEAKETYDSGDYTVYPNVKDWGDYAYELVESTGGVESLGDTAERYFDYEKLGRDIDLEYYPEDDDMPETVGEYWCGDEDATDEEIGMAAVDQLGFGGIGNPGAYFDYDAFGKDLSFEESGGPTDYGFVVIY